MKREVKVLKANSIRSKLEDYELSDYTTMAWVVVDPKDDSVEETLKHISGAIKSGDIVLFDNNPGQIYFESEFYNMPEHLKILDKNSLLDILKNIEF